MEGLEVQKFLKKNSLKKLSEDYGIKVKEHPHHVGLNYDQIKSPKTHLITRECRSLKLLKNDDWDVAGRSFDRFFNYGEAPDTYDAFDFSESVIMEKVDGSLISVWFNTVDQKWEISTRSSIFGDAVVGLNSRTTFRELVLKVFPTFSDFFAKCDDQKTYIFEYIGPDNRIVTAYDKSELVLLAIRDNLSGSYSDISVMEIFVSEVGLPTVRLPVLYRLKSFDDVMKAAKDLDGLQEGFVCWDIKNHLRVKVKSPQYVAIHHLRVKTLQGQDLLTAVLSGEVAEVLVYFPELQKEISEIEDKIAKIRKTLEEEYEKMLDIPTGKDLAGALFNHSNENVKMCAKFFFQARKTRKGVWETFNEFSISAQEKIIKQWC